MRDRSEKGNCRALRETVRTSSVQGEPLKGLKHRKRKFPEGVSAQFPPTPRLQEEKMWIPL